MSARESAYRRKSKNCLAAAEVAQDPKVKFVMLQIATGYEMMADRVDNPPLPEIRSDAENSGGGSTPLAKPDAVRGDMAEGAPALKSSAGLPMDCDNFG